jgi:hypothetical protein
VDAEDEVRPVALGEACRQLQLHEGDAPTLGIPLVRRNDVLRSHGMEQVPDNDPAAQ